MRQLGTTQSISFVAPPEVHQSILDVCNRKPSDRLDSSDVVTWLLDQTCTTNQELHPLYFAQGKDFCQRTQAAETWSESLVRPTHRDAYMKVLRQQERQDLEELYSPVRSSPEPGSKHMELRGKLRNFEKDLQQRQHWSHSAIRSSALEEVEQEREVAFEVEEEREVQRPQRLPTLEFPGLHGAIREFAEAGVLNGGAGYTKASNMLDNTELGKRYGAQTSSLLPHLYISDEFMKTVKTHNGKILDNYTVSHSSFYIFTNHANIILLQRSVNWVLWSLVTETAMVIVPEEAELLLPYLRATETPRVHLLIYAAPVTRKMQHFSRLDFYATPTLPRGWRPPSWVSFELGILSGRLYFDFSDYNYILHSLRCDADLSEYVEISSDPGKDTTAQIATKTTLAFLMEWLSIRRQGQDITHTPMGYVCQGWTLRSDHPFFLRRAVDQDSDTAANDSSGRSFQSSGVAADEDDYEYSGSETEEENEEFVDVDLEVGTERETVDGEV